MAIVIKKELVDLAVQTNRGRGHKFSPPKEEFINKYNELKSANKMAEFYNVCKKTILSYAKEIGYVNKYRNGLTDSQIQYVLDNYNNKTSTEIADELNISKSYVKQIWRTNGLKGKLQRKHYCDEHYFDNIDTQDKAYILGIIASDGCVYKRENHIGMLSFQFHIQEKDIIDIILKYMKANYKPRITKDRISLQINSDLIVNSLEKYNIYPRKTWDYFPVKLNSDELMWAFIRGYFDGDGSIYYSYSYNQQNFHNVPSKYIINFCGNKKTMYIFKDFFESKGIISKIYKDAHKNYSNEFYGLRIVDIESKLKFIHLLYKNCKDVKLNRKYVKCMEFIECYNEKYILKN